MKTSCPECATILAVSAAQLKARDGKVRCGVCHTVFNAYDYAVNAERPQSPEVPIVQAAATQYREPNRTSAYRDGPVYQDDHYIEDSRAYAPYGPATEGAIYNDYDDDYEAVTTKRRGGGIVLFFVTLILLLVLIAQTLIVFRNQIVRLVPSSHPLLLQLCSIAKCELGGTPSIEQLSLQDVSLNVRSDVAPRSAQTALRLQATLINQSNRPVNWPSLVLSLKDERGQVDRLRIISPSEYVTAALRTQPMGAQMQYPITLNLTLAGAMATAYELTPYYEE